MIGALGFLAFSAGAGLASIGLRNLAQGSGPDLREAVKEGIRCWKTIEAAAGAARAEFDAFQAEVRAEASQPGETQRRRIRLESAE